mgnify:CR=1 FL=1
MNSVPRRSGERFVDGHGLDAGIARIVFSIPSEDSSKTLATLDKLVAAMKQVG